MLRLRKRLPIGQVILAIAVGVVSGVYIFSPYVQSMQAAEASLQDSASNTPSTSKRNNQGQGNASEVSSGSESSDSVNK